MMGSPFLMILLLVFFSLVMAIVACCYKFDSQQEIIKNIPKRTITFSLVVILFGVVAYLTSAAVLMPDN